jgi:tRNA A37 threonylcarbamoyltransferase TsaD
VKKEDIARALVSHMCDDLAMNYYWTARGTKCKAVLVVGGFVEHPLIRDTIYHSFHGKYIEVRKLLMYFL